MNNFIKHNEWNPTSIGYAKCKANPGGKGRSGLVNNGRGKTLDIVLPPDMLTWGAEQAHDGDGNALDKYSLSIQFPNEEYPNEEQTAFLEKVKQFEAQLIEDAIQNYQEWFSTVGLRSKEEAAMHARMNFVSALKYKKDPLTQLPDMTKAPTMKIRLTSWDDEWKFRIYSKNTQKQVFPPTNDSEQLTLEEAIPKMSRITPFIRCGGRWFVNKTWGYKWNLVTAVITPSEYSTEDINPFDTIDFGPSSVAATPAPAAADEDDGIAYEAPAAATATVVAEAPAAPPASAPTPTAAAGAAVAAEDATNATEPDPDEPPPKKKKLLVKPKPK